jgi:hypothetical protein
MENKKGINFFLAIIAIITGSKLYKHFDFQNLRFEKPLIDTIFLLTFVGAVTLLIKDYLNRRKE